MGRLVATGAISTKLMTLMIFTKRFWPVRVCARGSGDELSLVIPTSALRTKKFVYAPSAMLHTWAQALGQKLDIDLSSA
jgi:hypothetical protein